jgi:glycosyltransferase involved in cell wall biosynthesis
MGQMTDISGYGSAARSYFKSLLRLEDQGLINLKIVNFSCESKIREDIDGNQIGTDIDPEIFNDLKKRSLFNRLYVSNQNVAVKEETVSFIEQGYEAIFFLLNNWLTSPWTRNGEAYYPDFGPILDKESGKTSLILEDQGKLLPNIYFLSNMASKLYPCFVWETDRMPDQFLNAYNGLSNLENILCACEWNKNTLNDSEVRVPGITVPYTISPKTDYNVELSQKLSEIKKGNFAMCSVAQWSHRKGFDILIKSFLMEFYKEDVTLFLKTYASIDEKTEAQNKYFAQIISNIKSTIQHNGKTIPNYKCKIVILSSIMNKEQINSIYQNSDAYVTTTRGEGFGLPIAEFLHFQKPVIVPDKGGHLDFCHPKSFYIESSYEPCFGMPNMPGLYSFEQNYVECSIRSTREQMRNCYNLYADSPDVFSILGKESYKYCSRYLSIENTTNIMKKAIGL